MTTWIIHGFNVWDNGAASVDRLHPYIDKSKDFDYGYTFLFRLRCVNRKAVKNLTRLIKPGDSIIAHSNGCLIAWEVAKKVSLGAVVCINPALRRDTRWPDNLPVLCLANTTDKVVSFGRAWGRLVSLGGIRPHGWGAAGRYGFTEYQPLVKIWFTDDAFWAMPSEGHSGTFVNPEYWGSLINQWIKEENGDEDNFNNVTPIPISFVEC